MGYDIYGIKTKSEKGEYFRNNVWGWRPLMRLIVFVYPNLTDKQIMNLSMNNGARFNHSFADKLAKGLKEILADEKTFKIAHRSIMDSLEVHNAGGENWYKCGLDEFKENVQNFAEFCENSGGFEVC